MLFFLIIRNATILSYNRLEQLWSFHFQLTFPAHLILDSITHFYTYSNFRIPRWRLGAKSPRWHKYISGRLIFTSLAQNRSGWPQRAMFFWYAMHIVMYRYLLTCKWTYMQFKSYANRNAYANKEIQYDAIAICISVCYVYVYIKRYIYIHIYVIQYM